MLRATLLKQWRPKHAGFCSGTLRAERLCSRSRSELPKWEEVPLAACELAGLLCCKSCGSCHASPSPGEQSCGLIHFNVQPLRLMPCACWWWSCSSRLMACLPAVFTIWMFGCVFSKSALSTLVFCHPCRSESGFCRATRAGGAGRRTGAWRVALPGDLHHGAAVAGRRLTGPGCAEPCVSQPAGRRARQPPQRYTALRAGQPLPCLPPPPLILFSLIAIADSHPLPVTGRSQNHFVRLSQHPEPNRPLLHRFVVPLSLFTPLPSSLLSTCRMLFMSDI